MTFIKTRSYLNIIYKMSGTRFDPSAELDSQKCMNWVNNYHLFPFTELKTSNKIYNQ